MPRGKGFKPVRDAVYDEIKNLEDLIKKSREVGSALSNLYGWIDPSKGGEFFSLLGYGTILDEHNINQWKKGVLEDIDKFIKLDRKFLKITERNIKYGFLAKKHEQAYKAYSALPPKLRVFPFFGKVQKKPGLERSWFTIFEKLLKQDEVLAKLLRRGELRSLEILKRCKVLIAGEKDFEAGKAVLKSTLEYLSEIHTSEARLLQAKYELLVNEGVLLKE